MNDFFQCSLATGLRVVFSVCCLWLVACSEPTPEPVAPAAVEWAAESDSGLYRLVIKPEAGATPIGAFHEWRVTVTDMQGAGVFPATIALTGGMPAHGHGLPTQPQVTDHLGDGQYRIEGMRFNMAGAWVLDFVVVGPAGRDSASFDLELAF
ncbi:MAG: FixH family protein [Gammaproteobacteria bacterium]